MLNEYFIKFSDFIAGFDLENKVEILKNFFNSNDAMYLYAFLSMVGYFILKYIATNVIYKADKKKRKSTIFNMKIITVSIVAASLLEVIGFHNKWFLYIFMGISIILVAYNIGSWGIFKRLSTVLETKKKIEDEKYIDSLVKHVESNNIKSLVDFKFNNKKYLYSKKGDSYTFREYGILLQTNKTTRLYDMFLVLGLFFVGLLYFAYIFNSFINKDSMVYGVLLLFGAAFILPYLQDVKNTIRFANNKYLAYGAFVLMKNNGGIIFGEIIDMNLYEIILIDHWTKEKIIISHSEMKIFSICDKGRFLEYEFVTSKIEQRILYKNLLNWINEYKDFEFFNNLTIKRFMHDFGYGTRLRFQITIDNLKKYGSINADFVDFLVGILDKKNIDHRTPIMETSIQLNTEQGGEKQISQSLENYTSVKK